MRTALIVVVIGVVASACGGWGPEPAPRTDVVDGNGPGATGTIALADHVYAPPTARLELRCFADDGGDGDVPADADAQSWPVTEVTFPMGYQCGRWNGISTAPVWRAVAWVGADVDTGGPGVLRGSAAFSLRACGDEIFCGTTAGVDLVLDLE